MPHFLISKKQIENNIITLDNDDNFFHLTKVLRIKAGENIKFIDSAGNVYYSKISKIDKKSLKAQIIKTEKSKRTIKDNVCLIQSVLMNDAQNLLIANATQTGEKEIYPVISDNTSAPYNSLINKKEKWEKIAYENFKQCERADMPKIHPVIKLKEAINNFKKENIIIFAEKYSAISLQDAIKDIDKNEKIALVIGPEGGFSEEEFDYFKEENFKLVSLGSVIYKAPNAVVAGAHSTIYMLENF